VLADRDDVDEVNRALTHGARGYIPTSVDCEVAVAALRLISAGGTFVPAGALRSTAEKPDDQPEGERQRRSDGLDLTPRELSVIDLLREGKPNKLIAARLEMQESTVKVHVRNILKRRVQRQALCRVRTGTRRPLVEVVAGTRRIGNRAVLMAGGVPMGGREFPPTGSGVPAAAPLIIPSPIGEAQAGAGVIRSLLQRRRLACGRDQPADRGVLRPLNPSRMRGRPLPPIVHTEQSPLQDTV
jgi:DNA-binding CsgD family transcriptional regulator